MISIADALRNEGRQEGWQEGRQEEQMTMIRKMLLAGISKEQVANIANLSLEKLNAMPLSLDEKAVGS